jgi:hypothetical protein
MNWSMTFNVLGQGGRTITVNMPRDKARSMFEYLSRYGVQAVIERCKRSREYRKWYDNEWPIRVRYITSPKGEIITQF